MKNVNPDLGGLSSVDFSLTFTISKLSGELGSFNMGSRNELLNSLSAESLASSKASCGSDAITTLVVAAPRLRAPSALFPNCFRVRWENNIFPIDRITMNSVNSFLRPVIGWQAGLRLDRVHRAHVAGFWLGCSGSIRFQGKLGFGNSLSN